MISGATPYEVHKYGHTLPVSAEEIAEARAYADAIRQYADATPEQRARWARESAERRAAQRAETPATALTVETLTAALDITPELARHLVQPYCACSVGSDGWDFCPHATDQGLTS